MKNGFRSRNHWSVVTLITNNPTGTHIRDACVVNVVHFTRMV